MREWTPQAERGRPSTYSREVADRICAERAAGKSLSAVCRLPGIPARSTISGWITSDIDGFAARYARARDIGLEVMADETIEIADDGRNDTYETDKGTLTNHDVIQRSRLRVDTRKWLLSKLVPKTYGDKIDLNHSGEIATRDLTDDQLNARISALFAAGGTALPAGGAGAAEGEEKAE